MEPRFTTKPEFKLIGPEVISNDKAEFGRLWEQFVPRIAEVKNRVNPSVFYGLCSCGPECQPDKGVCKCAENGFAYAACVEVADTDDVPAGMVANTIPASEYAVFTHKGGLDKLGETYNYIFQTWLAESGRQPSGAFCFELYDERFNPSGENSELDIYLPVK